MFRSVFRLILVVVAALFVRRVIVLIARAFSKAAGGSPPSSTARPEPEQLGGELKRDPVCGTFVAMASSIKATVNGEVVHFCSKACRDKFQRVA